MVDARTGAHSVELLHTRTLHTLLKLPFALGHELGSVARVLLPSAELGYVLPSQSEESGPAPQRSAGAQPVGQPAATAQTQGASGTAGADGTCAKQCAVDLADGDVVALPQVRGRHVSACALSQSSLTLDTTCCPQLWFALQMTHTCYHCVHKSA